MDRRFKMKPAEKGKTQGLTNHVKGLDLLS